MHICPPGVPANLDSLPSVRLAPPLRAFLTDASVGARLTHTACNEKAPFASAKIFAAPGKAVFESAVEPGVGEFTYPFGRDHWS